MFTSQAIINLIINVFPRANKLHNQMTRSHRRDTTMVALLFSIVIVFLSCHSCKLVLNLYEAVQVIIFFFIWSKWSMCAALRRCRQNKVATNNGIILGLYFSQKNFAQGLWNLPCDPQLPTMIYSVVNLTYPPESGLPIFRGWGLVALQTPAHKFPLVFMGDSKFKSNEKSWLKLILASLL